MGLQMDNGHNNKCALFEVQGSVSRVVDDRTVLVDILGKFEMSVLAACGVCLLYEQCWIQDLEN